VPSACNVQAGKAQAGKELKDHKEEKSFYHESHESTSSFAVPDYGVTKRI